jgi:hypothetical protein
MISSTLGYLEFPADQGRPLVKLQPAPHAVPKRSLRHMTVIEHMTVILIAPTLPSPSHWLRTRQRPTSEVTLS